MSDATRHLYAIAIGSNRATAGCKRPEAVLEAGIAALRTAGVTIVSTSRVVKSDPLGPARRRFANAVVFGETLLCPPDLLLMLKALERAFGRRPGRRWGDRTLDLDIILWSRGRWEERRLTIPHTAWRQRGFVSTPLAEIASRWPDPVARRSIRAAAARLKGAKGGSGRTIDVPLQVRGRSVRR